MIHLATLVDGPLPHCSLYACGLCHDHIQLHLYRDLVLLPVFYPFRHFAVPTSSLSPSVTDSIIVTLFSIWETHLALHCVTIIVLASIVICSRKLLESLTMRYLLEDKREDLSGMRLTVGKSPSLSSKLRASSAFILTSVAPCCCVCVEVDWKKWKMNEFIVQKIDKEHRVFCCRDKVLCPRPFELYKLQRNRSFHAPCSGSLKLSVAGDQFLTG